MMRVIKLLVVADSEDERALYARIILRKFPRAVITQSGLWAALKLELAAFDAVVVHFNGTPEATQLVQKIRAKKSVPIVALSGVNRAIDAIAAGVTRFILASEWLTLGPILSELILAAPARPVERAPEV